MPKNEIPDPIKMIEYATNRETLLGYAVLSPEHSTVLEKLINLYEANPTDVGDEVVTPTLFRLNISRDVTPKDIVTMNSLARAVVDFERTLR